MPADTTQVELSQEAKNEIERMVLNEFRPILEAVTHSIIQSIANATAAVSARMNADQKVTGYDITRTRRG